MALHGSIAHLPDAYRTLVPELKDAALPAEETADCANCPMVCQPDEPDPPERTVFHGQLRCCTYNPVLPNYLVGRILRRGGPGAGQVRKRLAERDGVSRWAIQPPERFYDRAAETPLGGGFGRDAERRCPYWVPGLTCSIWQDRDAVCRAWFCKYDDGWKGREHWLAFRDVLRIVQVKLCRVVGEAGESPGPEGTVDDWCAWYLGCADRLDGLSEEDVRALEDEGLAAARQRWLEALDHLHDERIPDVLGPAVTAFYPRGETVVLEGFSHYSPSTWPMAIFELFALMDGTVGWQEALERTGNRFTEADVRELYRLGILEARVPEDLVPGVRLRGVPAHRVSALEQEKVLFEWPDELS